MNKNLKNKIDRYTRIIRLKMNENISEIQGDYTGWCELGAMLMFRLVRDTYPDVENKVMKGFFDNDGHFWNEIDGCIVDTTVDQFGDIEAGVSEKSYYRYYNNFDEITFDEEDLVHMTDSDGIYEAILNEMW